MLNTSATSFRDVIAAAKARKALLEAEEKGDAPEEEEQKVTQQRQQPRSLAARKWQTLQLMNQYLAATKQLEHSRASARLHVQTQILKNSDLKEQPDLYCERSLLVFSKTNPLRRFAIWLTCHVWYERFTLSIILASCITLAMDSTREGFVHTGLGRVLAVLEYCWAATMSVEVLLRILAKGLIAHPKAFLRNGWGVLDVCVVVLGYLNLLPHASNLTAVRAFRVLRPLRAVSRLPKLKVLVVTLLTSLPMLSYVIVLCAIVYFAYGIIGVQLFAGALRHRCGSPDFSGAYPEPAPGNVTYLRNVTYWVGPDQQGTTCSGPDPRGDWTLAADGSPVAPPLHSGNGYSCAAGLYCVQFGNPNYGFTSYDNILWAWLTIFQCITEEGWTDVMYYTQDAVSYWVWPYYVSMIILGAIFLMNLALVVLYVQFTKSEAAVRHQIAQEEAALAALEVAGQEGSGSGGDDAGARQMMMMAAAMASRRGKGGEEEEEDSGEYSEAEEEEKGEEGKEVSKAPPRHLPGMVTLPSFAPPPSSSSSFWERAQYRLHALARSKGLYVLGVAAILLNTVVMCINWYGMPATLEVVLDWVNRGLVVYFVAELLIRIVGIGPRKFFKDGMNVFDTVVVVASIAELVVDLVPSVSGVAPLSVMRTLRFLRLARLVRSWPELQNVILTLMRSVVSVGWMSLLMLLFLVIAALLGMQLFGYRFQFCDYVPGAQPICPLGQRVWGDCPDHFNCYVTCTPQQVDTWLAVPGSKFGGWAYCQDWCEADDPSQCEQLAAVGGPDVSRARFDSFGWSMLAVFQVVTGENWNQVMYDGMRTEGPAASLYFIAVVIAGNYIVLNLFIAILLENFASNLDLGERHGSGGDSDDSDAGDDGDGLLDRTGSFIKQHAEANRSWFKSLFSRRGAGSRRVHPDEGDWGSAAEDVSVAGGTRRRGGGGPEPDSLFDEVVASEPTFFAAQIKSGQPAKRDPGKLASRHDISSDDDDAGREDDSGEGYDASCRDSPPESGRATAAARPARNGGALYGPSASMASTFAYHGGRGGPNGMKSMVQGRGDKLQHQEFMRGHSLLLFGPESVFRWRCMQLVTWKYFDYFIFGCIIVSSVMLAVDTPNLDEDTPLSKALRVLDIVWSIVFALEAGLKIVALGLLFNGRGSYLRDVWNVLDFVIMLAGVALLVLQFAVTSNQHNELHMLRVLRALRALRPLRFASSSERLKVVIQALFSSLTSLLHVGAVALLFYLLFGILGVNLLKGGFRYCEDASSGELLDADDLLPEGQSIDRTWCQAGVQAVTTSHYLSRYNLTLPAPYTLNTSWVNPITNFDNLGNSMLALFQVATLELWVDIMTSGIAAVGPDQQPVQGHNPAMALFFVAFLLVCSFLVLNLLVAITIEKFSEHHSRALGYNLFLTQQQQAWVDVQRMLSATKPEVCYVRPPARQGLRCRAYDLVMSKRFYVIMYVVVLANVVVLSTVHADMGDAWKDVNVYANIVFTSIFVVEAGLQLFALGPRQYFCDPWFLLLFLIAAAGVVSCVADIGSTAPFFGPLLRVVRVTRFVKVFTEAEGLQRLIRTLVFALPSIFNVGSVMLLFFFVWAVMGMNLFGTVKHGQYLTRHADFHSWTAAMMTLFRQLTGESWNGIMTDCMITTHCVLVMADYTSPATNATVAAGDYYSPGAYALNGVPSEYLDNQCSPSPFVAVLFFLSFELLCSFIIINIVVAIILEGMINDEADELLPVPRSSVVQFVHAWAELDPRASGYIRCSDLTMLLMALDPPLGVRGSCSLRLGVQAIIMSTDIPTRANKVHFMEVLHALCGRVCGAELPDMSEEKIHDRLAKRLPDCEACHKYTAAHFHAACHVRAAIRGFLARHRLAPELERFRCAVARMAEGQQARRQARGALAAAAAFAGGALPPVPAAGAGKADGKDGDAGGDGEEEAAAAAASAAAGARKKGGVVLLLGMLGKAWAGRSRRKQSAAASRRSTDSTGSSDGRASAEDCASLTEALQQLALEMYGPDGAANGGAKRHSGTIAAAAPGRRVGASKVVPINTPPPPPPAPSPLPVRSAERGGAAGGISGGNSGDGSSGGGVGKVPMSGVRSAPDMRLSLSLEQELEQLGLGADCEGKPPSASDGSGARGSGGTGSGSAGSVVRGSGASGGASGTGSGGTGSGGGHSQPLTLLAVRTALQPLQPLQRPRVQSPPHPHPHQPPVVPPLHLAHAPGPQAEQQPQPLPLLRSPHSPPPQHLPALVPRLPVHVQQQQQHSARERMAALVPDAGGEGEGEGAAAGPVSSSSAAASPHVNTTASCHSSAASPSHSPQSTPRAAPAAAAEPQPGMSEAADPANPSPDQANPDERVETFLMSMMLQEGAGSGQEGHGLPLAPPPAAPALPGTGSQSGLASSDSSSHGGHQSAAGSDVRSQQLLDLERHLSGSGQDGPEGDGDGPVNGGGREAPASGPLQPSGDATQARLPSISQSGAGRKYGSSSSSGGSVAGAADPRVAASLERDSASPRAVLSDLAAAELQRSHS